MATLEIYDSQGSPVRGGSGGENQQIKDFFFDGVRLAVDSNRNEMFCFFRARDNETARSEQYYAKYTYQSRSEMGNIFGAVKARIEDEYGMILDTETDDTRFFELLGSSNSGRVPDSSDLDDVADILSDFQSARLGVGSYREAYGLFSKLFSNPGVGKIAVSDNATGQSLSSYDLVIEKGDYYGLALLGDTDEKVESLRERRRSAFESDYDTDDGDDRLSGLMGAALFGGLGVVLIAAVVYGSCLGFGMALPGVGDPPGVASCGGPSLDSVNADAVGNGSQAVQITGNVSGMSNANATVNVSVLDDNGTEIFNDSGNRQIDGSGGFDFSVQPDGNATSLAPGNYTASVEFQGTTMNDSFTVESGSGTAQNNTTSSTTEGTTGDSIANITAQDTGDSATESFEITGTTTGLAGENITVTVDFSSQDDGPLVNSGGEQTVEVASDGTFTLTTAFDPNGTSSPYEVTVTHNDSSASDTFGPGSSTDPRFESLTVPESSVDSAEGKISFQGNISNVGPETVEMGIYVDNETTTIYSNESFSVEVEDDGSFGEFGVTVSEGGLPDGNYTLIATYAETSIEDEFRVSAATA